jgi:HK97 family phage prohead protease
MTEMERRYTPVPVQVRAREQRKRIGGYASVFNRYSQNLGGFVERVDPSFFNKSRADGWPDVIARYNHDDNMLLGTTGGRTLSLELDETGLLYEVDPPTARADIVELVERGDVRRSSFAFRAFEEDWGLTEQNFPLRTLLSGQLVDVAPVNMPAYPDATAGLRSLADKVGASLDEVRNLAASNDLRKFFMRTDSRGKPVEPKKQTMFGPAAAAAVLARREDPWS